MDKKILIGLRLYTIHDIDILSFMTTYQLDIAKTIHCVLKAYSRNDIFSITSSILQNSVPRFQKRVYRINIYLDIQQDQDIIQIMSKISHGHRNSFIKNLLRQYLCTPLTQIYLNNATDTELLINSSNLFRSQRPLINAADLFLLKSIQDHKLFKSKASLTEQKLVVNDASYSSKSTEDSTVSTANTSPLSNIEAQKQNHTTNAIAVQTMRTEKQLINLSENNSATEEDDDLTDIFSSLLQL